MSFPALQSLASIEGLGWREVRAEAESMPVGIRQFDAFTGGCPRGQITEITGSSSTGRTSLMHRVLSQAGALGEYCAIVDTADSFDPDSAAAAGVRLDSLVWVKCAGNAGHAMRSADLLIQGGGFGVVVLDLCDVPVEATRRIPLSYWYRFRRAVESTCTILLVLGREPHAKSCAALMTEVKRDRTEFSGAFPAKLLRKAEFQVTARKPYRKEPARFEASAIGPLPPL